VPAEQLLKWTKRGPKWKQAVETCMAAMADELTPDDARMAFVAAAQEEGMLMRSHGCLLSTCAPFGYTLRRTSGEPWGSLAGRLSGGTLGYA
jgi:hypothetical protein